MPLTATRQICGFVCAKIHRWLLSAKRVQVLSIVLARSGLDPLPTQLCNNLLWAIEAEGKRWSGLTVAEGTYCAVDIFFGRGLSTGRWYPATNVDDEISEFLVGTTVNCSRGLVGPVGLLCREI